MKISPFLLALFNKSGYTVFHGCLKEARRASRLVAPGWSVATTGGLKKFNKIFPVGNTQQTSYPRWLNKAFIIARFFVLCSSCFLSFSCFSAKEDKGDAVQESLDQIKPETTIPETNDDALHKQVQVVNSKGEINNQNDSNGTNEMNTIVIQSKDDVDALVVKYIKTKKAGQAFEPVHVIVPVTSPEDFEKAREYLGNLVGIASPFEVQIQNDITRPVDFSLNVKSTHPLHIIVSGKNADTVKLGHVSLKLSGDIVEVRHLSWHSIQEGHSIIKILNSREVIFDDVKFDDIKANDLPLPSDAMIAIYQEDDSEYKDASLTFRNSVFRNVHQRVGMALNEEARQTYAKVTFDHVTFDNAVFSSSGLDISVRENVLIHQCTLHQVSGSEVFSQFDNRASVTIEDSDLSGHVYRYAPPQAMKDQNVPTIVYKNNKLSDDASQGLGYGVSWSRIQ